MPSGKYFGEKMVKFLREWGFISIFVKVVKNWLFLLGEKKSLFFSTYLSQGSYRSVSSWQISIFFFWPKIWLKSVKMKRVGEKSVYFCSAGLEIRILFWVQKVATSNMGIGVDGGNLPHSKSDKALFMKLKTLYKGPYVPKKSKKYF